MTDNQAERTKFCPDCGAERPLSEFYRVKSAAARDGYRYTAYCKTHMKARNLQARKNAPEGSKLRETVKRVNREWAQQHPENARRNSANYRGRKKAQADPDEGAT